MAKKKATKKASKTKKKAKKRSTVSAPKPPENEEVDTFIFCTHRMNEYVDPHTSWDEFRGGTAALLLFHRQGLPGLGLTTEIRLFAKKLDLYLLGTGYAGTTSARRLIRHAIESPNEPIATLLKTVADNYR